VPSGSVDKTGTSSSIILKGEDPALNAREDHMPTYEYRCEKCANQFSVSMRIAEHDTETVACPSCKGPVMQQFSGFYAKTSKKS
jgi:putative FmdB family regulatory protein